MDIKVLIENSKEDSIKDPILFAEHGLSLYIETEQHKIVFDVGQTDQFAQNAQRMGIDLSEVDIAFISHGHYDHGGGLKTFLDLNKQSKVYIAESAFGEIYSQKAEGHLAYIGLNKDLKNHEQVVLMNTQTELQDNLSRLWTTDKRFKQPSMNQNLFVKTENNTYSPDSFNHEQSLIISENDRDLLITGCSHCGIMNILESYKSLKGKYPDTVIGGFHLASDRSGFIETMDTIVEIGEYLKSTGSMFYTGHCTGTKPYHYLKGILFDQLDALHTGKHIQL